MQCARPSFISPEIRNILALSRPPKTKHGSQDQRKGQCLCSTTCFRMDFAKRPLCSEFLEDFMALEFFLGISHPVIVFTGPEGGGRENTMENSVAKDSDLEGKS